MPVKVIAGCMATGRAPTRGRGASTSRPCRPEVCTTYWPARIAPHATSMSTTLLEHVVGHGEQQQVAGAGDGGRLERGYAGQQRLDAGAGGVGLAGGGDDLVAGRAERGGQDGADPAGADDADAVVGCRAPRGDGREVCVMLLSLSFQSRRPPS